MEEWGDLVGRGVNGRRGCLTMHLYGGEWWMGSAYDASTWFGGLNGKGCPKQLLGGEWWIGVTSGTSTRTPLSSFLVTRQTDGWTED